MDVDFCAGQTFQGLDGTQSNTLISGFVFPPSGIWCQFSEGFEPNCGWNVDHHSVHLSGQLCPKKNNLFSECWPFSPVHFQNIALVFSIVPKLLSDDSLLRHTVPWFIINRNKNTTCQENMFTNVSPFFCHDVIHLVTHLLWCLFFNFTWKLSSEDHTH